MHFVTYKCGRSDLKNNFHDTCTDLVYHCHDPENSKSTFGLCPIMDGPVCPSEMSLRKKLGKF